MRKILLPLVLSASVAYAQSTKPNDSIITVMRFPPYLCHVAVYEKPDTTLTETYCDNVSNGPGLDTFRSVTEFRHKGAKKISLMMLLQDNAGKVRTSKVEKEDIIIYMQFVPRRSKEADEIVKEYEKIVEKFRR